MEKLHELLMMYVDLTGGGPMLFIETGSCCFLHLFKPIILAGIMGSDPHPAYSCSCPQGVP